MKRMDWFMGRAAAKSMLIAALALAGCAEYDVENDEMIAESEQNLSLGCPSVGPYLLGENPVWNDATQCLLFADIAMGKVLEYCPSTGQTNVKLNGIAAFGLTVNHDGALIVGGPGGLLYVASETDVRPIVTHDPASGESIWVNEQVAVNGGIYFGDVKFDGTTFGGGNLYWVDSNGQAKRVLTNRHLPNGLGVSPNGRKLYFAVSVDRKIYSFDIDRQTGDLSNEHVFATLPASVGIYDGLTVNAAGEVIVAVWYGGQVLRYSADGELLETMELPVLQPSNVTLGGPGHRDLYITTAAAPFVNAMAPHDFDHNAPNLGGSLYRFRMDTPGLPEQKSRIAAPQD
jgi:D-xylono/L-arabinono-1,4-lactonase